MAAHPTLWDIGYMPTPTKSRAGAAYIAQPGIVEAMADMMTDLLLANREGRRDLSAEQIVEEMLDAMRAWPQRKPECAMSCEVEESDIGPMLLPPAWRPIETAPKEWRDGRDLDGWDARVGARSIIRWGKHNHVPLYGWVRQIELYGEKVDGFDPTHVRELPPPPAVREGDTV